MMLYYFKFFLLCFFCIIFSFTNYSHSILFLLLHSELLIIFLFLIFLNIAICFNINFLIGFSICYLIFGGMEIALNLILLVF